ncbi:MAG: HD domain-containing protein [Streptococcus sp.]|jgi:23S rRNA maturation-related 3'-5' exoribonuclease YhaM|uniref:HD domain-containing protein n=1 Tax=Streptococcus sp. TaxID=1306 RepID=UPI00399400B0
MAKKEEAAKAVQEAQENPVKTEIIETLKKTGRDGMDDLIAYMEEIGFFTAPASGGNHSNGEGGLAEHSLNVSHMAEKLSVALIGGANITDEIRNSVVIAALLHDLGKCGDYGKQMYVPNMIKDGKPTQKAPEQKYKQSEAKPWKRNPDLLPLDHATRSIKLATLFIDLTEDEEFAIRYHDGLYENANYGVKGNETQLYMILHWADMWSSRVLEGVTGEGGEE